MAETKKPEWTGLPCISCGERMPKVEQLGEWLLQAHSRAHEIALRDRQDFPAQVGKVEYLTNVIAYLEARITGTAYQLTERLCGDCSYKKHSQGDEVFHLRVAEALSKAFEAVPS